MLDAMIDFAPQLRSLKPEIDSTLIALKSGGIFSLAQGVGLAAAVLAREPTVVLDLGTGSGGSSCSMALASQLSRQHAPVYPFDLTPSWEKLMVPRLPPRTEWDRLRPIQGDITQFDFAPLVAGAERILIFWDAHGFSVAARVFSHIMPLIAEKEHLVICHDISDNRLYGNGTDYLSYQGKRMWRGTDDYFQNPTTTALLMLGWMQTAVEQSIAMQDFCYRNQLPIRTFDQDVHVEAAPEDKARLKDALFPEGVPGFHLTYFTMNGGKLRNFPSG